jgi:hypothetical protein
MSGGEENIANDESPHKCHSIKTYAISTFFNNSCPQPTILNLLREGNQITQLRPHGLPKINLILPEAKSIDPNNLS